MIFVAATEQKGKGAKTNPAPQPCGSARSSRPLPSRGRPPRQRHLGGPGSPENRLSAGATLWGTLFRSSETHLFICQVPPAS